MADLLPSLDNLRLLKVVPASPGSELDQLYRRAADSLDLSLLDFQGIRDLLALAGIDVLPAHALLLLHFHALAEGSLCLSLAKPSLEKSLAALTDTPAELAVDIHRFAHSPEAAPLIGNRQQVNAPLILIHTHRGPYLYSQKTYLNESLLSEQLQLLLAPRNLQDLPADDLLVPIVHAVTTLHPSHHGGQPVHLAPGQRLALWTALLQRFTIISGGPGTGKTSTVLSIIRSFARCGFSSSDIALAAPTGRAAQRLTESIVGGLRAIPAPLPEADQPLLGLAGVTIHSLLRFRPSSNSFAYGPHAPLPCRLLIIDEVSMVDVATMAALLQALSPTTRLIFLGDKDQLPSVETGSLLADLIPRHARQRFAPEFAARLRRLDPTLPPLHHTAVASPLVNRIVMLTESHRSEQPIKHVAAAVNNQQLHLIDHLAHLDSPADLLPLIDSGGCRFFDLPPRDRRLWQELLDAWIDLHYQRPASSESVPYPTLVRQAADLDLSLPAIPADSPHFALLDELFRATGRGRILTFIREGRLGCDGINAYTVARMRPLLDARARGQLFPGCPILVTRNDYRLQLFNGDTGLILRDHRGTWRAAFRRLNSYQLVPLDLLPAHEPAFAMTIHKSQGSEYDHVLVVLPANRQHRLLSKEILYTGLTRARHLALIAGTTPVLKQAISHPIVRTSGIDLWPPDPDDPGDSTWGSLQLFAQ